MHNSLLEPAHLVLQKTDRIVFFDCSSSSLVPKRKMNCSQAEQLFQKIFDVKMLLVEIEYCYF